MLRASQNLYKELSEQYARSDPRSKNIRAIQLVYLYHPQQTFRYSSCCLRKRLGSFRHLTAFKNKNRIFTVLISKIVVRS